MSDEYPDDADLARIREWPFTNPMGWIRFVQSVGKYWPDGVWGWDEEIVHPDGSLQVNLSTGGWSGNEDIVGAMMDNAMLWALTWRQSRRGGHFEFIIPAPGGDGKREGRWELIAGYTPTSRGISEREAGP